MSNYPFAGPHWNSETPPGIDEVFMPETDFIVALGRPRRTCWRSSASRTPGASAWSAAGCKQIGNDAGGVANLTNGANGNSVGPGPLVT